MHWARNALQLDTSRPIRRAAALLCRELYGCVVRECNETIIEESDATAVEGRSLVVEMVISGEEALYFALERCITGEDTEEKSKKTVLASGNKLSRIYDLATVSRCQEAVDNRNLAENEGFFAAAKLIAASKKRNEANPIAKLLRERRQDKVGALKGLKIDFDSLKLT